MKKQSNTCYSKSEMGFMIWGQNLRSRILMPLLKLIERHNILPNHITILSMISGIVAAFALLFSPNLAFLLIFVHVTLDGIDGPLARHMNINSNKGSFIDTASDQVVIAFIIFSLIHLKVISPLSGGIYILLYTIVVGFAIIRNALKIPYGWLIRPRFILYIWLPIEFYYLNGSTTFLLWFFNILLATKTITGFLKICSVTK